MLKMPKLPKERKKKHLHRPLGLLHAVLVMLRRRRPRRINSSTIESTTMTMMRKRRKRTMTMNRHSYYYLSFPFWCLLPKGSERDHLCITVSYLHLI
jgi:hypothetical protein